MNKLFVMNGGLVTLSDDERYVRYLTEEELAEVARRSNAWEEMASATNSAMKERPVLESIIAEIHRRADKEWAREGHDFAVWITAEEYKALCEEEGEKDERR